ncbi:response regulator [Campylobacter sp. faydin G-140]|uniref:response regulator n=1 Tax=Campylobacter anatolicus TaxID=2829105 RepID=UPI001B9217F1|nr:response regulator [Campylobacter anatolicus]MBR8464810.1 response regulator [Campylobacter anatolicus]
MQVENKTIVDYLLEAGSSKTTKADKAKERSDSFEHILNLSLDKAVASSSGTSDVEEFKQKLSELGAYGYLSQLNLDKIDEKIEQKKEELTELLGLNDPSKSTDERTELSKILEKLVADYRKELQSSLSNNSLLEKQQKLARTSSSNVNLGSILAEFGRNY